MITREEFEHMAMMLRPRLVRIGHDFFGSAAEAEDVAQETLVRLWIMRERLTDNDNFARLAVRMAKNICVSQWRKQQVRKRAVTDPPPLYEHNGETDMMDREYEQMMNSAIDKLTPYERRLFDMKQKHNGNIQELSNATGIKPRSVSAILSLARKKIYEYIKKKGGTT